MDYYLHHHGEIWINKTLLVEHFKIPQKSITNRLSDSSPTSWIYMKHQNDVFIKCSSIPDPTRRKYSLPDDNGILEIAKAEQAIYFGHELNKKRSEYKLLLEHSVRTFSKHVPHFIQLNGGGTAQIHECAKKHALLETAIAIIKRDGHGTRKHVIDIMRSSTLISDLKMPFGNVKDLYQYLKIAEKEKENNKLIEYVRHGLLGKKSNHTKINNETEKILIFLARSGNKLKKTTITHQVNVLLTLFPKINGSKLLGAKTVRNFLNTPNIKNLVSYASDPDHILKLEPQVNTHSVLRPLERVYIDGTKLQFIHKNLNGSAPIYRVIVFIIDSFSNRLLGFSISKTETTLALVRAIRMMLQITNNVFPEEVVTDRGSAMRSKVFKRMIDKINELGIKHSEENLDEVELIQSSRAQAKASAERFFRSFQDAYLRPEFGWVGEGITSTLKDARPNKVIKIALHNLNLLRDEIQLEDFIFNKIIHYNKFGFDLSTVEGPNDIYRQHLNSDVGIRLPHHLIPYICFPSTSIQFRNCAVRIINDKHEYIFQKIESELAGNLTGEVVDCYMDYDNPEEVFLYNASSPKYLTSMRRKSRINESRRKRGLDEERMFRETMKGKNEIKKHFDNKLKDNFKEVMEMFSQHYPNQIVSYSTEAKDSIYLMEFLEEMETQSAEINNILYNSTAVKKKSKKGTKKQHNRYSKSTF